MRSPRKTYIEEIRKLGDPSGRFIDMTARVRVYRRGTDGVGGPAEWLPETYGGVWDTWSRQYVRLGEPLEFKVHPGQVKLLDAFDDPTKKRVLALGSQGGGKTEGIITVACLLALWHPGKTGGVVAPTRGRIKVVWRKFLKTIPAHWIEAIRPGDNEIVLVNGSLIQFFAAKRQGKHSGSPFAGNDWWWAVEDEQQDIDQDSTEEVDARLRINANAQVFSSATNEPYGYFQRRVKQYGMDPSKSLVRFTGPENSFTDLKFWTDLASTWDPETYRRKILCEDVPVDGRIYGQFTQGTKDAPGNIAVPPHRPTIGRPLDITQEITQARYQEAYEYIVGTDFGQRVTASVILKAYRAPSGAGWLSTDRQWWIHDEVTTEGKTSDWHAAQLLEWMGGDPTRFIVVTGQDSNSKDPDKSDFVLFKRKGINVVRASYGKRIAISHRYSMMNALLYAQDRKRRLFVACDDQGRIKAKKTVESFQELRLNASDKAETYGKGTKGGEDLTHWTDAAGAALFPFENLRGAPATPTPQDDEHTDNGSRTTGSRSR